ncbi:hypothetical protein MNBD_ALPHA12-1645 [hydrothermal vent metagenome]|uniref:Outer membrane protein beta-barrel domain-containing protein n=1 Tax=hydrothermal vent metagenome TaxID=652676 RepID=A0A3B0TSL4_9ZZZZ
MHKLFFGIAASTLMVTGALAHSPVAPPAPAAPAPVYNSASFDWNGFYMGLGITGLALSTGVTNGIGDIIAGVNATSGDVLFGLEGWIGGWTNTTPASGYDAGVDVRLGYLAAPEAVIYLSAGGAILVPSGGVGTTYGTVGAGAEFALTNDVSLDVEYKYWMQSGGASTGNSFGASFNWGF